MAHLNLNDPPVAVLAPACSCPLVVIYSRALACNIDLTIVRLGLYKYVTTDYMYAIKQPAGGHPTATSSTRGRRNSRRATKLNYRRNGRRIPRCNEGGGEGGATVTQ